MHAMGWWEERVDCTQQLMVSHIVADLVKENDLLYIKSLYTIVIVVISMG